MQLSDIRASIQALGYGTDTAAQQTIFINTVYREVLGRARWKFLEKQDNSLTTVVGTAKYAVPMTDWRNIDAVRLEITAIQQYDDLQYLNEQELHSMLHVDRDNATPYYWTLFQNQLWFYPTPDQVYTVVIDYIYEPPDLAADSDIPVMPTTYHDILVWGALKSLAQRERDWIGVNIASGEYETLEKRMEEEFMIRQRQTSSHVKMSGGDNTSIAFPYIRSWS